MKIPSSYDIVGDILIIDIPESLKNNEKKIALHLLNSHKHINTVVKKKGIHSGRYRLQKYTVIAGEKKKEALYKENGVLLKLNIEKTYFSPRLATERLRTSRLVKKGESVLVMFSGVAPYPLVIAKNSDAKEVYGVEINPHAHEYALENVKLNKFSNIKLYNGDVRKILPKIRKKFDRIFMPLPKDAYHFLDVALKKLKKGGVIHMYEFHDAEDMFTMPIEKVKEACAKAKRKFKVIDIVKCGQYSPRRYRVCVEFKVS